MAHRVRTYGPVHLGRRRDVLPASPDKLGSLDDTLVQRFRRLFGFLVRLVRLGYLVRIDGSDANFLEPSL